jgi:hypothetical protein
LSANGVEIPVIVAKDTQRRHVHKRALMVNFDVVCTKIGCNYWNKINEIQSEIWSISCMQIFKILLESSQSVAFYLKLKITIYIAFTCLILSQELSFKSFFINITKTLWHLRKKIICFNEIIFRITELLLRNYEITFRFYELIFRYFEITNRFYELIFRKNKLIFRKNELIFRN